MPVLSNPRYERFAQGIAKGKSQGDAYRYAGYKDGLQKDMRSNASVLIRKPEIAARVQELQDKQSHRIGVSVDDLVRELDEMLRLAKTIKQPSAGVGAILAKGKLLGLIVDKVETGETVRKPANGPTDKKQMSMEEWQAKFSPTAPKGTLQ